MAKLEDVLPYLSPDLIEKTYNMIQSPATTGTGILSAIKDFDAVEAANFIKEKAADYAFDTYLGGDLETITGGGINPDQTGLASGIFNQAGDVALNELGLPVSTADVKDIASAFTDPGAEGGITEVANIGFDLIKRMGKEKALDLVISQLGISHPLAAFIMRTPVGADLRTMGGDVLGMTGIPDAYNFLLNKGKNILGFDVNAPDPVINTSQPGVIDQYIASLNQPTVTQNDDGTQTISGGTSDPSDDIVVTNLPVQTPTDHHPSMADVAGPSTPTPTPTPTPTKDYNYYANWEPGSGTGWRHGGLASVSRYLKGR